MSRPLIQLGVADLEAMFQTGKLDQKVLGQLEVELKHRQVPRAVALLKEVQAVQAHAPQGRLMASEPAAIQALNDAGTFGPLEKTALAFADSSTAQADLRASFVASEKDSVAEIPTFNDDHVLPRPALTPQPRSRCKSRTSGGVGSEATVSSAKLTADAGKTAMMAEEAIAILKTPPDSNWQIIEIARRTLIELTSPWRLENLSAEETQRALVEARELNSVYLRLATSRCVKF